ncbi:MAG TPA: hypothetical protein VEY30_00225, partial [Myxococcaceae bacterium]|nr:hypothetical protein [Myxococcaceae bacterium]
MNNGIHPEGPADGVEASDAEAPRPSSEPVAGLKGAPTSLVEEMTVETSASGPSPLRASEAPVPLPGPPAAPEAPLVPSVSVSSDEDLLVPASASPPSRGQRTHVAPAQVLLERVD